MRVNIRTERTFYDITERVEQYLYNLLHDTGVPYTGYLHIQTMHTTCRLDIMEWEPLLQQDIKRFLDEWVPQHVAYAHNDIKNRPVPENERLNAHSHLRAMFFPPFLIVKVNYGKLVLGEWQRIVLVELDPGRERSIEINELDPLA